MARLFSVCFDIFVHHLFISGKKIVAKTGYI